MGNVLLGHDMQNSACEKRVLASLNLPNGLDVKAGAHVCGFLFSFNDAKSFRGRLISPDLIAGF